MVAASLKRDDLLDQRLGIDPFPRPRGRGLIEADSEIEWWRSHAHFRGHVVAASLKLFKRLGARSRFELFPQPRGRGLIEAGPRLRSRCCNPHFRGHVVAASLKHILSDLDHVAFVDFRGHVVAASLKRTDARAA